MKESAQTINSMDNSLVQSSTIRPKKKAMTLVPDPTALNRYSSFEKLLGRQVKKTSNSFVFIMMSLSSCHQT